MTPEQICDVLVKQGIIQLYDSYPDGTRRYFSSHMDSMEPQLAEKFIAEPRVAMAVMERLAAIEIDTIGNPWWVAATKPGQPHKYSKVTGNNLSAAIIEAGAAALQEQNDD